MSRSKIDWVPFGVFLTLPLSGLLYFLTNTGGENVYNMQIGLDEMIPFVTLFVLPYMLWYPFVYTSMAYLLFKDRSTYYRFMLVLNLCFVVCFTIYTQYQTTFTRPVVVGTDWLSEIVRMVQSYDEPYNCFPSLHVVTSYLVMRAFHRSRVQSSGIRWTVYGLGWAVILSTLFVKQHVLMDVIGGILLVEVMTGLVWLAEYVRSGKSKDLAR